MPVTYQGFRLAADLKNEALVQPWLIKDLIPYDSLVILASAPKTGKTVLATALARAVATGGSFLGQTYKKHPVLWCAHEETIHERFAAVGDLTPQDPLYLSFENDLLALDDPACENGPDRFGRFNPNVVPYVFQTARELKAPLIIIDCLHAAVRHSNLADNQVARRIVGRLRHWAAKFQVGVLLLHHVTKSAHRGYHPERFADSSQILASASCHFFLESVETEEGRKITIHGAGRLPAPPKRIEIISHGVNHFERIDPQVIAERKTVSAQILALLEQGWNLTAIEIAQKLALNPRSVQNALRNVPNLKTNPGPTRAPRYSLPLENE